ncbi:MAG: hypothetical protein ACRC0X_04030 [Brevinema sp.]
MGLKNLLQEKKKEQGMKRNLYNQLLEETEASQKSLISKMALHRKVFALYKNLYN